jgi:hypothetical protein
LQTSILARRSSEQTCHQSNLLGSHLICDCECDINSSGLYLHKLSEIEDCTREWTFKSNFADYIHARWLFGSIKNWDGFFAEAFRVCKPGGWVESHEAASSVTSDDNTVDPNSAMGHWGKFFLEGGKKIGTSFTVVEDGTQRKAMEAAGFTNIQEFEFRASFTSCDDSLWV